MAHDMDKEKLWITVLSAIKTEVSDGAFKAYFRDTQLAEITDSQERWVCSVGCKSGFIKNILEQRYLGMMTLELSRVTDKKCEIILVVKSVSSSAEASDGQESLPLFEVNKTDNFISDLKRANLREDFTFENYAVASSNQMAYAAAQAVAKSLGVSYNPLFIYGGVGVGKTHLMQAIGQTTLHNGFTNILFCSGEEFTNDLVEAIRYKTTEKVRNKYRKVKLLMIDDVQFIAGKPSVQEEFFHTFNTIMKDGGQVVMTSDKPPGEITKLEERLKSRFGAGLIVDIGPANFELRTAILLIKAKQRGIDLPMDIAQMIAEKIEGIRELQGCLVKLETEERIRSRKLNREEIEAILKIGEKKALRTRVITPNEIISLVGDFYGVGATQLKGERRTKTIVWPRQVLMYILRQELKLSLDEVGRIVGGRDHTTVLHATDKVIGELSQNHVFKTELSELKNRIFGQMLTT
jgi:chromosomal replication initiator protein